MLSEYFRKKYSAFEILQPQMSITKRMSNNIDQLKANNIEYHIVAKGYLCFQANVFRKDTLLNVGLHYDFGQLQFIELFRPVEYYNAQYDIDASFADFNEQIISRYGSPTFKVIIPTTDDFIGSKAEWYMRGMKIEHWIMDRFGPEEHLHIFLK